MKKSLKKISLLAVIMLVCALVLAGCGSKEDPAEPQKPVDPAQGKWALSTITAEGTELSAKDVEMESFTLEFDGNGSVAINDGENSATSSYTVENKTVTIKEGEEVLMSAEVKDDGTLYVADFYGTGMQMTFTKAQ